MKTERFNKLIDVLENGTTWKKSNKDTLDYYNEYNVIQFGLLNYVGGTVLAQYDTTRDSVVVGNVYTFTFIQRFLIDRVIAKVVKKMKKIEKAENLENEISFFERVFPRKEG